MSSRSRSTAALVASLVLLVGLAGCGSSPKPKSLPTPSPTAGSATSASQPPPSPPKEMTKARGSAIEFARYFVALVNYASKSGDTKDIRSAYISQCTKCQAFADAIDSTYDKGGRITGGDWTVSSFKFYGIDNDVAVLDARVDFAAQVWVKSAGATPQRFGASQNNLKAFNLRWQGSKWAVSALDPNT